ncbi:MAG: serine/threonine protein kinase [Myxococcales bacterium]|nr:serine/threonine protein kinase [Myxococcales bacterium]
MQPGLTSSGYRFVRVLGRGSRAVVWEAVHVVTSRMVAVKVLDTLDPDERKRLANEYQAMALLQHPNVVGVHALLEVEGRLALVIDLVQGPDLESYLAETPPDRELALQLFGGILRGLAAAHAQGFVHRDLKPGNVLLTSTSPPVPRIADFGIVKAESDTSITNTGLILGTVRYMAPEQLKNPSGVDARADLFSAGCILFELLTHTKAFDAPNKVALMNVVRLKRHTPFPDDLDPEHRQLLDELLDPEPENRPDTAVAVLERLGLPEEADTELPASDVVAVRSRAAFYVTIGGAILVALGIVAAGLRSLLAP